jgi:hypothetical protein
VKVLLFLAFHPIDHQRDEKLKVIQALFEHTKNQFIVNGFIAMYEHVSEGSHVLKSRQMFLINDSMFSQNTEQVTITSWFSPFIERNEVICNVYYLLNRQM